MGTVTRCPHAVHSTPKTLPTPSRIAHLRTSVDQLFLTPSLSSHRLLQPPLSSIVSTAIVFVSPRYPIDHIVRALHLPTPLIDNWPFESKAPRCMCACNIGFLQCILPSTSRLLTSIEFSKLLDAFQDRFPRCLSGTSDRPPRSARHPCSFWRSSLPRRS